MDHDNDAHVICNPWRLQPPQEISLSSASYNTYAVEDVSNSKTTNKWISFDHIRPSEPIRLDIIPKSLNSDFTREPPGTSLLRLRRVFEHLRIPMVVSFARSPYQCHT